VQASSREGKAKDVVALHDVEEKLKLNTKALLAKKMATIALPEGTVDSKACLEIEALSRKNIFLRHRKGRLLARRKDAA